MSGGPVPASMKRIRAPRAATSCDVHCGGDPGGTVRTLARTLAPPQAGASARFSSTFACTFACMADDIHCHAADLTTRNEFHNGKAQKKGKRWIDHDLSAGIWCKTLQAIVRRVSLGARAA